MADKTFTERLIAVQSQLGDIFYVKATANAQTKLRAEANTYCLTHRQLISKSFFKNERNNPNQIITH